MYHACYMVVTRSNTINRPPGMLTMHVDILDVDGY